MNARLGAALLIAITVASARAPRAEAQTTRGLVIGIDEYAELDDLLGAVNDARDIAAALEGSGVQDLVVLEDGSGGVDAIEAATMTAADAVLVLYAAFVVGGGWRWPRHLPSRGLRLGVTAVVVLELRRGITSLLTCLDFAPSRT